MAESTVDFELTLARNQESLGSRQDEIKQHTNHTNAINLLRTNDHQDSISDTKMPAR